ncbi:hypothetical protein BU26DRAFT_592469 [Trematosphaeria pertusa]|uniref:DUF7730 domain-containing protein n=1 Tax=Trematosphaeria pertusa TaxID=390896 RepID=A0A6A6IMM2_9PLEO|nr:uncharacterized protein BU26DRAFT_592469 [Trematosphaeria pertusa]KAF2251348.1 hypothetical protein BU26DRAFT_592469 [Trematosphaeria pertusa]
MDSPAVQEHMEITARNSTDSPLLRLPGELRDRIFRLAIGGHVIAVTRDGRGIQLLDPVSTKKYRPATATRGTKSSHRGRARFLQGERIPGAERVSRIFTLAFVCRQIHSESQLLPYKHNIFHFDTPWSFGSFTKRLSTPQRQAIFSVSVGGDYIIEKILFPRRRAGLRPPTVYPIVPNLKRFYFFFPLTDYNGGPDQEWMARVAVHFLGRGEREEELEVFFVDVGGEVRIEAALLAEARLEART